MAVNPGNYNLCIVGFGNVGKASVKLLQHKSTELGERHGIKWKIGYIPWLISIKHDADLETTAYGMLADFIRAVNDE